MLSTQEVERRKKSPAWAGLSVSEERRTTAYAVRSTNRSLARPLRSLCDGDHKNAHFVVASLRVPSAETAPVVDQRWQIGSLRKKKSPALVSGAEVSRIVLRSSVTKQFRSGRLVPANGCCDRRLRATTCVPRYAPASSRWMKEAGAPKKAPPWRGLVFTVQWCGIVAHLSQTADEGVVFGTEKRKSPGQKPWPGQSWALSATVRS